MMTFSDIAANLFHDYGLDFDYSRMNAVDQRRLCAAYVRNDPSILEDLLVAIKPECIAEAIATLIESDSTANAMEHCDVFDLAQEIRSGVFPNKDLTSLVEGELDRQWRRYLDQLTELARPQAD